MSYSSHPGEEHAYQEFTPQQEKAQYAATKKKRAWYSRPGLIIPLVVVALILFLMGKSAWDLNSAATKYETETLNPEARKAEGLLSEYYTNGHNALSIAASDTEAINKINQIMNKVIVGGYGGPATLNNKTNPVYQQIVLAYPQVGGIDAAYKEAESVLVGSFDNWVDENTTLFDEVGHYQDLLYGNPWTHMVSGWEGLPSQLLSFNGETGQAALVAMDRVIVDPATENAYKNGTLAPQTFPTP